MMRMCFCCAIKNKLNMPFQTPRGGSGGLEPCNSRNFQRTSYTHKHADGQTKGDPMNFPQSLSPSHY